MDGGKYYNLEKVNFSDSIKLIKKLISKKPDYNFIQPFEAKRYKIYSKYFSSTENDTNNFLKKIKFSKNEAYYFFTSEKFILLENRDKISYLTFPYWRPYIKKHFPQ